MGIGLEDVRTAVANATADQPKGGVGKDVWQSIGMDDQIFDAATWKKIVVHWANPTDVINPALGSDSTLILGAPAPVDPTLGGASNGATLAAAAPTISAQAAIQASEIPAAPTQVNGNLGAGAIYLGDIADVTDDVENRRVAGWYDGERTVMVIIRRQPGANILDVIERIKGLMPELAASISPAIHMEIAVDRAGTIRASVHDVERTLIISILLVVGVVFVFLRSLRATAIPSVVVPLSLVATFGAMYALGFSLDNLSLMALTIATGFVVDDAIVVTENVTRFIEEGETPRRAALKGASRSASRSSASRARCSRCSSRCCSWAARSAVCFASSRSRSRCRSPCPRSSR